ncbi:MAG: hypothetical protein HFI87_07010 [Bacilli bacterium]|nr:hypothetical protein [Bacilli bacterium]
MYSEEAHNNYIEQLEKQGFISEKKNVFLAHYVLEAYKKKLNLQMFQNSLLWSIVNIENLKKAELELLYKKVMVVKFEDIDSFDEKKENQVLLKLLENNRGLYEYIIYTQNLDDYMKDNDCRYKVKHLLKAYK